MTTSLHNFSLCDGGKLIPYNANEKYLQYSPESGLIIGSSDVPTDDVIDLQGTIVAPGFLELQTNGMRGFHFTHFEDEVSYASKIDEVARYLPSQGVTGFYITIPTVSSKAFKTILLHTKPREISRGASLLGAHAEGPYLHPAKKGAHNSSLFFEPTTSPVEVYGHVANDSSTLKLVTLAPEGNESAKLIKQLTGKGIRVSLGHSNATYDQGLSAVESGASCLTHTLNAMAPLHHRDPGLAGLVTAAPSKNASPYFSIIPDGNHLHPSVVSMLFRANPQKCIVITDSIELAGLEDGVYPGHAQIPHQQEKKGTKVVIEGTETLIGGCASLAKCVRNVIEWSGCEVAEGVRSVTQSISDLMGDDTRGRLSAGRRADFVVLDNKANVLQTWVGGRKVWEEHIARTGNTDAR